MFGRTLFNELDQMQKEMNNLLGDLSFGRMLDSNLPLMTDRYDIPALNLGEDEHNYYVEAQLPGFDLNAVELAIQNHHLKISGQRERQDADKVRWHRSERGYGAFERTIKMPRDIDVERISAEGKNGVLRVVLPKAESAKPKKIDIKVG